MSNPFIEEPPKSGISSNFYKYCTYCYKEYNPEYMKKHLKTKYHKRNVIYKKEYEYIKQQKQIFNNFFN